MAINEKYSFKDFSGRDFSKLDPKKEFNNTEIVGSCFYQENKPFSEIFPALMTGVTFKRCNLDNVKVPAGNTIITEDWEKCCNKQIHVQNDLRDWEVDKDLKAVKPLHNDGENVDPIKIPANYAKEETINKLDYDAKYSGVTPDLTATWYLTKPEIQDTIEKTVVAEIDKVRWDQMVKDNNFYPFSSKPVLGETKDYAQKDGSTVKKVIVKGIVTEYIILGEGKVYKDQSETISPTGISAPKKGTDK